MARKTKNHKLEEIIPLLSDDQMNVVGGMIEDAKFMEKQLIKLRETIDRDGVSESYQYGSKMTAAMTSYLNIQKQYGTIIKFLASLIPDGSAKDSDELLDFIKS